jgi:hypothetical protein
MAPARLKKRSNDGLYSKTARRVDSGPRRSTCWQEEMMKLSSRAANALLWTGQGLLALLFLFAGGTKLAMDPAELAAQAHMSAAFLQFIGACELLGGIGLLLPDLLGIRRELSPLAAAGLVIIMAGAVVTTLVMQPSPGAAFPLVIGVLLAVVGWQRWRRYNPRPWQARTNTSGAALSSTGC